MTRLRSLAKRGKAAVRRQLTARGVILIYHRVVEGPGDPWRLSVTPERFAAQLEMLRRSGLAIVPLSELARQLSQGKPRRGTIALSFDDGYRDNLTEARPILERFEVPATLFATSGYVGRGEEFWWDVLQRVFLEPGELPPVLELAVGEETYRLDLGPDSKLTPAHARALAAWKPFDEPPTARHRAHDELWQLLVRTDPEPRDRAIADLLAWAGLPSAARDSHRTLSAQELRELGRDDLVDIGAHSINHPGLGQMPEAVRMREIAGSKAQLEEVLGRPVRGFAYPQGRSSAEVQAQTREAGFDYACGSVYEAVTARSELFHMPRVSARDWDGERLRSMISRHLPL